MKKLIKYLLWGFAIVLVSILLYPPASEFVRQKTQAPVCQGVLVAHCGYNNVTYANECEFVKAQNALTDELRLYHYGSCGAQIRCLPSQIQVCGTDNKTYPNECVATRLAQVGIFKQGSC
jgi:hypothetical protein